MNATIATPARTPATECFCNAPRCTFESPCPRRHETADGEHVVFVYGILKTPDVAADPPDAAEGCMYVAGFAQVRFDEPGLVRGQVRVVDDDTLRQWDHIEGLYGNDQGLYTRIRIRTTDGRECWSYQINRNVDRLPVIEDGLWIRGRRG